MERACLPGMPWADRRSGARPRRAAGLRLFPAVRRPGPRPGVPAADVAVLVVRPGPAGGRPDRARGAEGRRAGRARRAGRRRGAPGRRSRAAAGGRPGRRVRQPARRFLAGAARRPRARAGARRRAGRRDPRLLRPDARRGPAAALAERAARLAAGGVLLLQYHSLDTIIRCGQWNALRHGHYAYYSTTALTAMLAAHGFSPRTAWQFELYGGTVLLAASRDAGQRGPGRTGRWPRCSRRMRGLASATRPCSAACSATRRPAPGAARLAGRRALRGEHRARLRRRLACGRPAAPGGSGSHAAARGGRRLAGQAGPADAGDGHPGRQPGPARRATGRMPCCCSWRTC